jgi:hypothetical protein
MRLPCSRCTVSFKRRAPFSVFDKLLAFASANALIPAAAEVFESAFVELVAPITTANHVRDDFPNP